MGIKMNNDEGCGLDGHGEHNWHFVKSSKPNLIFRKCSFCLRVEESKVQWYPKYE